ncbi:hypothetical protein TNCV_356201 [Trichonephila clavipes]|nr:hypothetical protein TNCV_356201 [Trichonephila clavipes]
MFHCSTLFLSRFHSRPKNREANKSAETQSRHVGVYWRGDCRLKLWQFIVVKSYKESFPEQDLRSFRALGAEDLHAPLAQVDRSL